MDYPLLVLKSHENRREHYLPMKFHVNNIGIHGGIHGFP